MDADVRRAATSRRYSAEQKEHAVRMVLDALARDRSRRSAEEEPLSRKFDHRDYGLAGTTIDVTVWDDRIEIRSPGPPPCAISSSWTLRSKLGYWRLDRGRARLRSDGCWLNCVVGVKQPNDTLLRSCPASTWTICSLRCSSGVSWNAWAMPAAPNMLNELAAAGLVRPAGNTRARRYHWVEDRAED